MSKVKCRTVDIITNGFSSKLEIRSNSFNLLFAHRFNKFFFTFHSFAWSSSFAISLVHLHRCESCALGIFIYVIFVLVYFCYLLTVQCSLFIFFACLERWKNILSGSWLLLSLHKLGFLFVFVYFLCTDMPFWKKFSSAQFYIQRLSFADSSNLCSGCIARIAWKIILNEKLKYRKKSLEHFTACAIGLIRFFIYIVAYTKSKRMMAKAGKWQILKKVVCHWKSLLCGQK